MKLKIVVYETNPLILDVFKELGDHHQLVFVDDLLSAANAHEHDNADIICMDQSILDEGVLKKFKNLAMIAVRSTGFDHIDTGFCSQNAIAVCNVPGYAANAVAEHTFALLLGLSRHLEAAQKYTRNTRFVWDGLAGFELQGKTMAVIGTGAIGKRVATLACALDMRVVAYDLKPDQNWANGLGIAYLDFEPAIQCADVVSLNVPLSNKEGFLIGEPEFAKMKDGVVLINTARGELVDPRALISALNSGKVQAAGLDVLPDEHYIREKETCAEAYFAGGFDPQLMLANELLCRHPKVLVTPHIGWYTNEADLRALNASIANINAFAHGKKQNVVNP